MTRKEHKFPFLSNTGSIIFLAVDLGRINLCQSIFEFNMRIDTTFLKPILSPTSSFNSEFPPGHTRKFPQIFFFLPNSFCRSQHTSSCTNGRLLVLFGISTMNDANHISDVSIKKRENNNVKLQRCMIFERPVTTDNVMEKQ